jgi:hypothetical protein
MFVPTRTPLIPDPSPRSEGRREHDLDRAENPSPVFDGRGVRVRARA